MWFFGNDIFEVWGIVCKLFDFFVNFGEFWKDGIDL